MAQSFSHWLHELFANADRKRKLHPKRKSPTRRRLECELLEDRVVPAITILNAASGGTLDADLAADGIVSSAGGTLSRGSLQAFAAAADFSVTSTAGDITFSNLTAPLALSTGAGHSASFVSLNGSITFADLTDTVTTAGGGLNFTAGANLSLAGLNAGSGSINLTAAGNIAVEGQIATSGGDITIAADSDDNGAGGFTNTALGSLNAGTGAVSIAATAIRLVGTIDGATVTLQQAGTTTFGIGLGADERATTGGPINEIEPNNTIAGAQVLGTILSSVDITATGDGTYDYYSFDAETGDTISFETTLGNFDTELFLYDSGGILLAENDDIPFPFSLLSFLQVTIPASGTYTIGVGRYNSFGSAGGITGLAPLAGNTYTLAIITSGSIVPRFAISDAELDLITADTIRIGRTDNGGDITIVTQISPANATTLSLLTGRSVVDGTAGEQADLIVENLQFLAFNGVGVGAGGDIDTAVNVLAASIANGGFSLSNSGDLIVGTVDGLDGVQAISGGTLGISATGSLTVDRRIVGSSVKLTAVDAAGAGQDLIIAAGAGVTSLDNAFDLIAGDNLIVAGTLEMSGSGPIRLSVDQGNSDPAVGGFLDLTAATIATPTPILITGGSGADTFNVSPFAGNAITVLGGAPGGSPGDTLNLDFTGATGATFQPGAPGAGRFSFADRQTVNYSGIETLVTGDVYALVIDMATLGFQNSSPDPDVVNISTTAGGLLQISVQNNSVDAAVSAFSGLAANVTLVTVIGSTDRESFLIDETNGGLPPIDVRGNAPVISPGDALSIILTNTTGVTLIPGAPGSGAFTFTNRDSVQFSGIENLQTNSVSIAVTDGTVSERGTNESPDSALFTLTRDGIAGPSLTVFYTVSGTAQNGIDYQPLPGSVTFAAGSTTATISVIVRNNSAIEGTRTVTVTLFPGPNYDLTGASSADATIADNDRLRSGFQTSSGAGPASDIRVFTGGIRTASASFDPFRGFTGGVVVAFGDVNGDGIADYAAGVAGGTVPHVKVFDGVTGAELLSFFAFDVSYVGGVTLALGDLDGDGAAEIIVGAAAGTPHVKIYGGVSGAEIASFFAYTSADGSPAPTGVSVGAGDTDGDNRAEIVTGARSISPHVKIFDIAGNTLRSFFAYDRPSTYGGISIAVGDLNGDGIADIAAGTTVGVQSRISVIDSSGAILRTLTLPPASPFAPSVAIGDTDRNGSLELIVSIGPKVSVFDGISFGVLYETFPYAGYSGNVYVGA